jgi:glycerol-3-phosphate dehydrogenase (NAD(P)+)
MVTMAAARRNVRLLPAHPFPANLQVTGDLRAALAGVRDVLLVVPSSAFREVLAKALGAASRDLRVAWGTKGFEPGTGHVLGDVVAEVAGRSVPAAVLSGPTFAGEVAAGLPTAVTLAANDACYAEALARRLHHERFRIYTSDDMVGVQVGGAVKNVLAIAAGIADGLGFGANTRAALITRGLAELVRLGIAMGGERATFMGLAGLGDLVLTCTDDQSRNRRLGLALAQGQSLDQALDKIGQAVEGVRSTEEVIRLARRAGIDMPISQQVGWVLRGARSPRAAVDTLLARELKRESS